jgi:hypothetical protein
MTTPTRLTLLPSDVPVSGETCRPGEQPEYCPECLSADGIKVRLKYEPGDRADKFIHGLGAVPGDREPAKYVCACGWCVKIEDDRDE